MEDLYAIEGAPDVPDAFAAWFIDDAIRSWRQSGFGNWAVCLKASDMRSGERIIGLARFLSEEMLGEAAEEALEVGWAIHPAVGRRGLATEAARAVIDYGFNVLEVPLIEALTSRENTPSIGLMERLGMKNSGERSPYGYDDCVLYGVTQEEWSG